jgi:hypothetical protein
MNSVYGDHLLARMIVNERISHREHIQLGPYRNLGNIFSSLVDQVAAFFKGKLQEPELLPVYCFEYAPNC